MKKLFSAFIIAAAVATAFSCSKIERTEPVAGEVHTVTFNAISPATKTTFGTLSAGKFPTYWTANDTEVKVAQNFSAGVDATVTKNSDTEASFAADFTVGSAPYTFYAVSPASAVVSGVNSTYYSWNLEIPTTQTTTATGPDEAAMIMAATSSSSATFPDNVNLTFRHITAYVNMNITNLDLAVGDEVASVLITADANIAYRYYYYVGGAKEGTLEENGSQSSITVLTDHADNIWFACAPMAAGTELTISVTTTNSKVYTKVVNTPADLAAGHVASFDINFSGITPPADKVYNLVTSYAELTAGSKVIIAAVGSTAYAAGIGTTESDFISAVSQAKSSGNTKIINPAATVDIFTIEAGGTANTIALHGTNGYLFAKSDSKNQMGIQTTNDVNGYWTPTIVDPGTGEMSLVATGSSNRNYMHYNGDRFSCYASTSSVTALQALYKLEGSGSGPSLITTYTITYDGNGNTGGSAPAAFVTPGAFTVAAAGTLEKSGYIFNGWNTVADGSGTPYAAGDAAVATADMTLYAQWILDAGPTEHVATINFGNAAGSTKIQGSSSSGTGTVTYTDTGNDSEGNTWTITTVTSNDKSFTQNASYSQVGASAKPVTSITFTTTLSKSATSISLRAKFGGFSGTAGDITLKVGDTSIGSGALNATNDVTVSSTTTGSGTVLTVTVTNIAKGVKCYWLEATYTN